MKQFKVLSFLYALLIFLPVTGGAQNLPSSKSSTGTPEEKMETLSSPLTEESQPYVIKRSSSQKKISSPIKISPVFKDVMNQIKDLRAQEGTQRLGSQGIKSRGGADAGGGLLLSDVFSTSTVPKNLVLGLKYIADFKRLVTRYLDEAATLNYRPEVIAKIRAAMDSNIRVSFGPLYVQGDLVDAHCLKKDRTIVLSLIRYPKMLNESVRARLALHEYAQMANLEESRALSGVSTEIADVVERAHLSKRQKELEKSSQDDDQSDERHFEYTGQTVLIGDLYFSEVIYKGQTFVKITKQTFLETATNICYYYSDIKFSRFEVGMNRYGPTACDLWDPRFLRDQRNAQRDPEFWKYRLSRLHQYKELEEDIENAGKSVRSFFSQEISLLKAKTEKSLTQEFSSLLFGIGTGEDSAKMVNHLVTELLQPAINDQLKQFASGNPEEKLFSFLNYYIYKSLSHRISQEAHEAQKTLVIESKTGHDPFKDANSPQDLQETNPSSFSLMNLQEDKNPEIAEYASLLSEEEDAQLLENFLNALASHVWSSIVKVVSE